MANRRPSAVNDYSYVPHVHHKGQDVYIDMQHAEHGFDDPITFAAEPWKHCKDHVNCFLGLRESMREEFKKNLDKKRRDRIMHEEKRIKQTRANFVSYGKNQRMMNHLKEARREWKTEVLETIEKRKRLPRYPEGWSRNQILDLELLERVSLWKVDDGPEDPQLKPKAEDPQLKSKAEEEYGFKACAIYFKKSDDGWKPHTHKHSKFLPDGKFPNQKISVNDLLQDAPDNPLTEDCKEDQLRYFHFPSNNMRWIEEAMARYYNEDTGEHSDTKSPSNSSSKAEKVLSREFWRGQVHGGGGVGGVGVTGPVHARHMRSRCSLIPLDTSSGAYTQRSRISTRSASSQSVTTTKGKAKNFAIFLPYLHWETDSRRAKMAQVIKEVTKELEAKNDRKMGRNRTIESSDKICRHDRGCLPWKKDCKHCMREEERRQEEKRKANDESKDESARERGIFGAVKKLKDMKHVKDIGKRSKLGEYLMALAQVADAMDYEADERLLRENLHCNPPLHIRRTLDQSYFLTLEDTAVRDKDQVVYRETRAGRSFHTRNTRVVMVDQLWLWILDGNTIITSFPRRWGRNKPDPSGVHKSLRERLENTPEEEIQSVYDLALIIIDQCSRVFFDRTKPLDQRPEVMDLFASAIGNVTEHTTIAYESFWRNMEIRAIRSAPPSSISTTNHKYLDINPEGTLLRESQDIAEELQIMLRIYNQQLHVVRDFRKILGHMNGESKNETDEVRTLINLLRQNQIFAGEGGKPTDAPGQKIVVPESTIQGANDLLELIRNRKAEIQDLEAAALRTTQQLQGLLNLKQQQASIIEAKAALARADESVKQGRAIMAFTLVTIFFLPLGFLAAFFGMNNEQINQASWMTLNEQMKYMFGLSTAVIALSISIAFSPWTRATLTALVKIPIIFVLEYSGMRRVWKCYIVGHEYFEEKNRVRIEWIHQHPNRVEQRREDERKRLKREKEEWALGGGEERGAVVNGTGNGNGTGTGTGTGNGNGNENRNGNAVVIGEEGSRTRNWSSRFARGGIGNGGLGFRIGMSAHRTGNGTVTNGIDVEKGVMES